MLLCICLSTAGLLHAANSSGSGIALIQKATFSLQPSASGTVDLTLPQATGAGHTLIVGVSFWPLDITGVSDGSGDVFTRGLATSISHDVSGSSLYTNFYYAKTTGGGTTALTLNFSGGSTYVLVSVAEVAGLDSSAPLDQSGFHDSLTATAAWSSAAITTKAANEYLFSWAATAASNPSCSTPASGWTIETQTNDSNGATVCLLDRIVSATGSYQSSVTPSSQANYLMEIVSFQSSSSTPPAPAPVLNSVSPNSGNQGQSLSSVILTGSNFQSGATCAFGSGITVNSCTFDSATQLTASIVIGASAVAGARSVTVTNPDNQASTDSNAFTVAAAGPLPAPVLNSVSPASGAQGQTLTAVTLAGSNFQSGATCSFGAGITVNSCTFNSATQLTASIAISATASQGARSVTVTNPDNQASTLSNAFSVSAPPAISVIQKATFSRQPTTSGSVTLTLPQATGAGHTLIVGLTFWPADVTGVTDGSGDTFTRGLTTSINHEVYGSVTFSNFYYAKSTAGGTNSLTLNFNGGSTYLLVSVAEVAGLNSSAPLDQYAYHESLTSTTAWSSAAITTTAANEYLFSWAASESASSSCSSPASGWTIENQTNDTSAGATVCLLDRIVSATGSYQASLTASSAADYAMEIVSFQTGSSSPPPPLPAPTLTSLNPNSGAIGQTLASVVFAGNNFQSGAICIFGAGITVNSCTFNSPTQLTANITITSKATTGPYNATVTNPDGQQSTLTNGFTVTAAGPSPAPSLTSINPNSGTQGQTLTSVILTGSNFQSGATCNLGAGVTVNSCTFNSATQVTASIAISSSAALGSRNVTVTNPDNQASTLSNAFSVNSPSSIALIQKATFSLQPSASGTVALTLPQATGAGHTLIVGVSFWPLDITGVSDGSGDAFTRGLTTSTAHAVSGSSLYTNFYYAKSTAGGTTSLTLNFSGGSTYVLVTVAEVAGLNASTPLDQAAYHDSLTSTTPWSSAAVTTTATNEYLFSWAATAASNASCSSPASGWTIETQTNDSNGATVCLVDRIVSATGSYQASVTPSSQANYVMEIVTFH